MNTPRRRLANTLQLTRSNLGIVTDDQVSGWVQDRAVIRLTFS